MENGTYPFSALLAHLSPSASEEGWTDPRKQGSVAYPHPSPHDPQIREVGSLAVVHPPLNQPTWIFRPIPLISMYRFSPVLFRVPTRIGQNTLKGSSPRYEDPLNLPEYRNLNLMKWL